MSSWNSVDRHIQIDVGRYPHITISYFVKSQPSTSTSVEAEDGASALRIRTANPCMRVCNFIISKELEANVNRDEVWKANAYHDLHTGLKCSEIPKKDQSLDHILEKQMWAHVCQEVERMKEFKTWVTTEKERLEALQQVRKIVNSLPNLTITPQVVNQAKADPVQKFLRQSFEGDSPPHLSKIEKGKLGEHLNSIMDRILTNMSNSYYGYARGEIQEKVTMGDGKLADAITGKMDQLLTEMGIPRIMENGVVNVLVTFS